LLCKGGEIKQKQILHFVKDDNAPVVGKILGSRSGFRFHEEFARQGKQDKHGGADGEDVADAGELGERSREKQAENLRSEDAGHKGRADTAHQFGRGFLLHERLGGDDDARYRAADEEVAEQGAPDVGEQA